MDKIIEIKDKIIANYGQINSTQWTNKQHAMGKIIARYGQKNSTSFKIKNIYKGVGFLWQCKVQEQ